MKKVAIGWSRRSVRDLVQIKNYIAHDKPQAAQRFVELIKAKTEAVSKHPLAGRMVPELCRVDVREIIVGNYRVIYKTDKKKINVLTVFESHRLLKNSLKPS